MARLDLTVAKVKIIHNKKKIESKNVIVIAVEETEKE